MPTEVEIVDITGSGRRRSRISDVKPKKKEKNAKTENVCKIIQCAQPPREGRACEGKCTRKSCETIQHHEKLEIYYKFVKKTLKEQTEMILKNLTIEVVRKKDKTKVSERPIYKINKHEVCRTTFCHIYGISSSRITRILKFQNVQTKEVEECDKNCKKSCCKKQESRKVLNIFAKNADIEIRAIQREPIPIAPKETIDLTMTEVGDLDTIHQFLTNSMWLNYSGADVVQTDSDVIEIEE